MEEDHISGKEELGTADPVEVAALCRLGFIFKANGDNPYRKSGMLT